MGLLVLAACCGFVAFKLRRWRQVCIFFSQRQPWNIPIGWHSQLFRYGSWVISTVAAVVSAACIAKLIADNISPLLGKISFWIFLAGLWIGSGMSGTAEGFRQEEWLKEHPRPQRDDPQ